MKKKWSLQVSSNRGSYSVQEWGPDIILGLSQRKLLVIVDCEVSRHHKVFMASLPENAQVIEIQVNESLKSFDNLGELINQLVSRGVDKTYVLVAVGGGALQDAVGFIASIYMRGIDWIFLPTTILSMGDSCIGSKTSINFSHHKNLLGNFNPPTKIFIRREFLDSLSNDNYWSGVGELCHYFALEQSGEELINNVTQTRLEPSALFYFIQKSLEIKKAYIEADEFDQGPRKLLNFGHTFGHALEAATGYRIPHGIAVAWGARLAVNLSSDMNLLGKESAENFSIKMDRIIGRFSLPSTTRHELWEAILMDKKTQNGTPHAILTQGYGKMMVEPLVCDSVTLNAIDKALAILEKRRVVSTNDQ